MEAFFIGKCFVFFRFLRPDYVERQTGKRVRWIVLVVTVLLLSFLAKDYGQLTEEKERWEREQSRLVREQRRAEIDARTVNHSAALGRSLDSAVSGSDCVELSGCIDNKGTSSKFTASRMVNNPFHGTENFRFISASRDNSGVSMLEYARRLSKELMLANVQLTSHQIQQQDPQKPIRFVVQAHWSIK